MSALPLLLCRGQCCGHIRRFSDLFYPNEHTGNIMSDTKMVVCGLFKLFVVPCVCSQVGVAVPRVLQGRRGFHHPVLFHLPLLKGMWSIQGHRVMWRLQFLGKDLSART